MENRLIFSLNREILQFRVKDKIISYTDRRWKDWIQCIPKDKKLIMRIKMSRNKIPQALADLFNLTPAEKKEYNEAKDDEELCKIVIRDCIRKGLKLEKHMKHGSS